MMGQCPHTDVQESDYWYGEHLVKVRQCRNCMMYDPPDKKNATPRSPLIVGFLFSLIAQFGARNTRKPGPPLSGAPK